MHRQTPFVDKSLDRGPIPVTHHGTFPSPRPHGPSRRPDPHRIAHHHGMRPPRQTSTPTRIVPHGMNPRPHGPSRRPDPHRIAHHHGMRPPRQTSTPTRIVPHGISPRHPGPSRRPDPHRIARHHGMRPRHLPRRRRAHPKQACPKPRDHPSRRPRRRPLSHPKRQYQTSARPHMPRAKSRHRGKVRSLENRSGMPNMAPVLSSAKRGTARMLN